ncbi:MAG: hypothetical protein ACJ8AW_30810 [Rhodopila sp.]
MGAIRASDLAAGVIAHMLRVEIPATMADANGGKMVSYSWPQDQMDGCALSGQGCAAYSGTIPYGVTIGIPITVPEPPEVKSNAGAHMLWTALQTHGAMIRDTGGSGNVVTFQTDQDVPSSNPMIQGMQALGPKIMLAAHILMNQGKNSINGGGTPVVPLSPEPGSNGACPTAQRSPSLGVE